MIHVIDANGTNPRRIWWLTNEARVRSNLVLPKGYYEDGWLRDIAGDLLVNQLIDKEILVEDKNGTKG